MTDWEQRLIRRVHGWMQSVEQEIRSVRYSQERQEQQRDVQPLWLNSVLAERKQAETENAAHQEKNYRVQQSLKRATWCAFTAAAIYAGIAYWQKVTMDRTYFEIQRQTQAAKDAVKAAQDSIVQARDQFRQDQRPYLWFKDLGQPQFIETDRVKHIGQIVWTSHFTNYGKAPAYEVQSSRRFRVGIDQPFRQSYGFVPDPAGTGAPIPPTYDGFNTAVSELGVSADDFQRLIVTDRALAVQWTFDYRDSYGCHYQSHACFWHLASGSIQYCPRENDITDCKDERK